MFRHRRSALSARPRAAIAISAALVLVMAFAGTVLGHHTLPSASFACDPVAPTGAQTGTVTWHVDDWTTDPTGGQAYATDVYVWDSLNGSGYTFIGDFAFTSGNYLTGFGGTFSGGTATTVQIKVDLKPGTTWGDGVASTGPWLSGTISRADCAAPTPTPPPPTLELVKVVSGGAAVPSDWTLNAGSLTDSFSGPGPIVGPSPIAAGVDYTLFESGGPSGYTPSGWVCTDPTGAPVSLAGQQLTLQAGQNVTCTITNTYTPPPTPTNPTIPCTPANGCTLPTPTPTPTPTTTPTPTPTTATTPTPTPTVTPTPTPTGGVEAATATPKATPPATSTIGSPEGPTGSSFPIVLAALVGLALSVLLLTPSTWISRATRRRR